MEANTALEVRCQVSPVSFEHYERLLYNNFIVYCIMLNAIPLKQTDVSSGFVSERRMHHCAASSNKLGATL